MSEETPVSDESWESYPPSDTDEPLGGASPEILDEDPLPEEQPYAVLEEQDDDFPLEGLDHSNGGGSW
jgi:hypothetical protein